MPGYRIGQVRLVFSIPSQSVETLFPDTPFVPPQHLAYIQWFTPFSNREEPHGMYRVTRSTQGGDRLASIVPVSSIRRSIHLLPKFGPIVPREWTSSNVLDMCSSFFVNQHTDGHSFITLH